MKLLPRLRFPVARRGLTLETVDFELHKLTIDGSKEGFYECCAPGCRGCGCPPFPFADGAAVPAEVIAHLQEHIRQCHNTTEFGARYHP